jgi:hypothetical protein
MMKAKDKKKDTLASRARAKAVDTMMQAPSRRASSPMATPSGLASMQPPGSAPMAMKKGGAVKMKAGGMTPKGGKKPGLMIMIAMGKKKGR